MSLASLLAETSPTAMRALLERVAPSHAVKVEWSGDRRAYLRSLNAMLVSAAFGELDFALNALQTLTTEVGYAALRSIAAVDPAQLEQFDAQPDHGARAIYVYLHHPDGFQEALAAEEADRKFGGRSADGFVFTGYPPREIVLDDELREQLAARLRGVRIERPPSSKIGVELFRRRPRDRKTGTLRETVHISIYIEQASEADVGVAEAGQTTRSTRRPTARAAALIDLTEMTIDVFVLGGKDVREQLANAVIETVIPNGERGRRVERRLLDVAPLKRPRALDVRADDPIERAIVVSILVAPEDEFGGLMMFKRRDESGGSDVYAAAQKWIGADNPITNPAWRVISADIRFFFKPTPEGKTGRAPTATLTAPNRTNLHSFPDDQRRAIISLLERWGISEKPGDAESSMDGE